MQTLTRGATQDATLAPVVDALHEIYRDLGEHVARLSHDTVTLPPVVFVVQRDSQAWGHITTRPTWGQEYEAPDEDYAYAPWAMSIGLGTVTKTAGFFEIMVSGENLGRGARAVFGTVAHETAHAINLVRGVRDVDSNGRHNKRFKETAEHFFGLTIEEYSPNHWAGWTKTTVGRVCAEKWARQIARLDDAIRVASGHKTETGGGLGGFFVGGGTTSTGRNKNMTKAVCGCGSIIRTSARALAKGITCGGCGEDFTPAD